MAKTSGLGDNFFVNGVDVSGDTSQLGEIGGGNEPIDLTAINVSARERQGGLRDGRIKWTSYFNATNAHLKYNDLPTTDVPVMYYRGTTLGNPAASVYGKQINYDGTRGDDGTFTFDLEDLGNSYGLEWGESLTAGIRTDAVTTNGASVDYGAAVGTTNFGAQAYIHVFSCTAVLAAINVQSSTDDGAGDAFTNVTGLAFACATGQAPKAERAATTASLPIERYLRVVTSGSLTSISFALMVVRNMTATAF